MHVPYLSKHTTTTTSIVIKYIMLRIIHKSCCHTIMIKNTYSKMLILGSRQQACNYQQQACFSQVLVLLIPLPYPGYLLGTLYMNDHLLSELRSRFPQQLSLITFLCKFLS